MKITLLDGSIKEFSSPKTVKEIANTLGTSLGKATIGAKINRTQLVPESFLLETDAQLELITNKSEDYPTFLNNTAAFLTLVALKKELPEVKIGEISFHFEKMEFQVAFLIEPRLKLEKLAFLQKQIYGLLDQELVVYKNNLKKVATWFAQDEYQLAIAKKSFEKNNYVLVYELAGVRIVTDQPLLENFKNLKALELQQLTGAYWQNDAKNPMFQKIHGMVGISQEDLNQKKVTTDERRSHDHREINQQLSFFGFDNLIGPGLPLWLPNGTIVKDEIKKYLKTKEWEYDYIQVQTPVIGTVDLYKTSGHWDHYRDDMFQAFKGGKDSNEEFVLRPMNCPHHIAVYKQNLHSYRELPIRLAEHAIQYRYESSGSLTGLERVRAMELTDSHIFARPDQVKSEFKVIYQLIEEVLKTFNIEIDYLSFSVRDPQVKTKYYPDDEMWNHAEAELEAVLNDLNLRYKKNVGEAAFYGPKLDIQIKTAQNHEITVSTIQLDFLLPKKFNVTYVDADQSLKHPIMIHRGLVGTYERFIATLLEQTKGALPLWLAPIQIEILPIGDELNIQYAKELQKRFKKEFIRSHIDYREERLSWKIREAQMHKIPYQLVIGSEEQKTKTVTYRTYGSEEQKNLPFSEFIELVIKQIKTKK